MSIALRGSPHHRRTRRRSRSCSSHPADRRRSWPTTSRRRATMRRVQSERRQHAHRRRAWHRAGVRPRRWRVLVGRELRGPVLVPADRRRQRADRSVHPARRVRRHPDRRLVLRARHRRPPDARLARSGRLGRHLPVRDGRVDAHDVRAHRPDADRRGAVLARPPRAGCLRDRHALRPQLALVFSARSTIA